METKKVKIIIEIEDGFIFQSDEKEIEEKLLKRANILKEQIIKHCDKINYKNIEIKQERLKNE
jgi:hypothetical protein